MGIDHLLKIEPCALRIAEKSMNKNNERIYLGRFRNESVAARIDSIYPGEVVLIRHIHTDSKEMYAGN